MTRQQRDWLRTQIDQAKRDRLNNHRTQNPRLYCTGCGCLNQDQTTGCKTCHDRKRRRARREREGVPCSNQCGTVIAPQYQARPGTRWTGLCSVCYTQQRSLARSTA